MNPAPRQDRPSAMTVILAGTVRVMIVAVEGRPQIGITSGPFPVIATRTDR